MQNVARPRLALLDAAQREAVHEASLDDPWRSGLRVDSRRARDICAKGGARIEGDRVYVDADLVDAAIESAPAEIGIFDRAGIRHSGSGTGRRVRRGRHESLVPGPDHDELTPFSPRRHGPLRPALPRRCPITT
jgi:trimethylamine--corrinoid protein Co-methyltransferase